MKILFYILFRFFLEGLKAIFKSIIRFFYKNIRTLSIIIIVLSYIIPITISMESGWKIPELLLLYYFIAAFILLFMLMGALIDENEHRYDYNDYVNNPNNQYRQKIHYPYISPEKRRNGGLSDVEVKTKKEQIRKKLKEKNMI